MTSPLQIFARKKRDQTPLAMLALYDAPSARIACDAGLDAILIGDSMGNTLLGYDSTLPVTLDDIALHTGAVARGAKASTRPDVAIVADMPFGSYATPELAAQGAVRLLQAGAHAVKVEGAPAGVFEKLSEVGVPAMGHIGFTPQSVLKFDNVVQGRSAAQGAQLLEQARELEARGAFAVVLEAMTREVAARITGALGVATVGIGAGAGCDGQVLVWHDALGLTPRPFRFARSFANTAQLWNEAIGSYVTQVQTREFPAPENGWEMSEDELHLWDASQIEPLDEQPF